MKANIEKFPIYALIYGYLGVMSPLANAEAVAIPVGQQSLNSSIAVPRAGMSKARVEQQFGAPTHRAASVGDPPISSWEYSGFTVYFEYDRVIHAVVSHSKSSR